MRNISIVLILLILGLLLPLQQARACSVAPPTMRDHLQRAEVVAIGKLNNATDDVVKLQVTEYLKGSLHESELHLNNHQFGLEADCRMTLGPGGRFHEEMPVLVFLEPDQFGIGADWRPVGLLGDGVYSIEGDQVVALGFSQEPITSLDAVKTDIANFYGPAQAPDEAASNTSNSTARSVSLSRTSLVALGFGIAITISLGIAAWGTRRRTTFRSH
jgi:hypothetical protein